MSRLRHLMLLLAVVSGLALSACETDDAIERDTRETRTTIEDGAQDAQDEVDTAIEDVDGK